MIELNEELKSLYDLNKDWNVCQRSNFEVLNECTEYLKNSKFIEVIDCIVDYVKEDNILDIQLVCLHLQSYVNINKSADDFIAIFEVLEKIINSYDRLSPSNKKETIFLKSILALLNSSNDAINYYHPDFLDTQAEQIINFLSQIQDHLTNNIRDLDLINFNKVRSELVATISRFIIKSENGEEEAKQEGHTEEPEEKEISKQDESFKNFNLENTSSFYWQNLMLKLARFDKLINLSDESSKFELALLFDSIQNEIDNFNPIKYFPNEFEILLKSVTSDIYTEMTNIIGSSKGSPLWDFMLQKVETNISIRPESEALQLGTVDVVDSSANNGYSEEEDFLGREEQNHNDWVD
ncbi:type VI secretion system protein IglI family protein [Francisella philomiragia]|uniref:type VI secretion system protein IglI family protein n=1 Tax=Francisella philomiragia TaxID=28110 RepID=UPI0035136831